MTLEIGISAAVLAAAAICLILVAIQTAGLKKSVEQNRRDIEQYIITSEDRCRTITADSGQHLEDVRQLLDKQLEQVYRGLGQMQSLAADVSSLSRIMTNVKTRGILGEIQLGAILSEILAPEQYAQNVATKHDSKNVVEYAVRIPSGDSIVYLPIDSKLPGDTYSRLRDAVDSGDRAAVADARRQLIATIRSEARDIRDKYIDPPYTTDFAVMFLPFEGLYAEVVNLGLIEVLQKDYRVNIAGPSTMAALLNSIQMSFKAFVIQKRSDEVWKVLSGVKTEFARFESALDMAQQRINQAGDELDKLVGVRTRQIQKSLRSVEMLDESSGGVEMFDASLINVKMPGESTKSIDIHGENGGFYGN